MVHAHHRLAVSTAMGLLLSLGLAGQALSQNVTTSGKVELDPIVVDAATDPATHPTPAGTADAITIDAAELARKQPTSVASAIAGVPGVNVARADDLVNSDVSIRNFGGNSAMPGGQAVVFALDGVSTAGGSFYRNAAGQIVDPMLLKSVTVLKGPLASLEYGSGIVGGTIAMETINAADLTGDQVGVKFRQVLGANSNGRGWKTSSTLAWQPSESFDMLLSYARSYSNDKKDGNGDKIDLGGYNLPSILVKGRYRFGDSRAHSLTFTYDKSESEQQNVPFAMSSIISAFGNVNRERTGHVTSLAYGYQPTDNPLIDFELKYSQSRQHFVVEGLSAISSMFAGEYDVDTDTLSAKNTARFSTWGIEHTLRAGVEVSHQEHDGVMSGVAGAGKYNRAGVFAIDQMDLGHDLVVTAGGRLERQSLYDLVNTRGAALDPMDTTARSAGLGFEKGLGYGFAGYASFAYSEGLTLPEYAGYSDSDGTYWGDRTFKSRNWETGVKFDGNSLLAEGDRLSATVGLFKTDIRDNNTYPSNSYNMLSSSGLEAMLGYQMADGLYSRATLTTTFANRYRANADSEWLQYQYALMDQASFTLGKDWGNGFDTSWTIRGGFGQDLNNVHQPGWGVNDVAASYTFAEGNLEGLRVDLGVDNLFNKQYVQQYTTSSASYPEAGRNFKFTLSKTF